MFWKSKAVSGAVVVGLCLLVGLFILSRPDPAKQQYSSPNQASSEIALVENTKEGMESANSSANDFSGESAISSEQGRVSSSPRSVSTDGGRTEDTNRLNDAAAPSDSRSIANILEGADMTDPKVRAQIVKQVKDKELGERQQVLEKAKDLGLAVRVEQPDGSIIELVGFRGDEPIYRTTHNLNASISSGANIIREAPYGLTGSGIAVGVWDGGSVRSSHQELSHNTSLNNPGAQLSEHATHVAGTIGASGVRNSATGMAPAVDLRSFDWGSDLTEMLAAGAASANDVGLISLSNHSYGIISGYHWNGSTWRWYGNGTSISSTEEDFGRYHSLSRDWDAVAHSLPYLTIFKAAGNDRNDTPLSGNSVYSPNGSYLFSYGNGSGPKGDGDYRSGYENQSYSAVAKNIITVGAVNDAVAGNSRSLAAASMSSFSCWGPTDDGRVKPDLVANGVSLESPVVRTDSAYGTKSGTSMATPSATGSAALLMELYRNEFGQGLMRSSLMKGLLIHTVDDLGLPGPDYQYGWGLINVQAAAGLLLEHQANLASPRIIESVVTTATPSYSHEFEWDGVSPIRATLCWTDPAGAIVSMHDSRTPNLVNNLDLTLTAPNGQVFRPFVMPFVGDWSVNSMAQAAGTGKNDVDNVEQVLIAMPPQPGSYTAKVAADGNVSGGRQSFSLLLSGVASSAGNQDSRILRLSGNLAFGAVEVGQSASRSVTVQNIGNAPLSVSGIDLPTGFLADWSGALAAGASASFDVTFSPAAAEPYSGSLSVYSDADNGIATLSVSGEGIAATVIQTLTSGTEVSGLSGLAGSERYYKLSVPLNQSELRFKINGDGDADLYVRYGSLPTISEWDHRPYLSSSNEEVLVDSPAPGDWYVMIRGYTEYFDLSLVATYQSSLLLTRVIDLQGDLDYGNIPIGANVSRELTIRNTGTGPLTVTGMSLPNGFSGSWSGVIPAGGIQVVELTFAPFSEQVYLGQLSVASDKTSGVHTRSISGTGVMTQIGLQNGVTAGPFSGLSDSMSFFYIDVPDGQSSLSFQLQGLDGEADLYLRYGNPPTLQNFELRSFDSGHDDSLTVDNPEAGRWYILLHAVTQITEIRLSAEYQEASSSQRIIRLTGNLDFGSVRVNQTETRSLTINNDGDVALSVFGLSVPQGFSATWSGTVQPGDSREVAIRFSPTSVADYSGTLAVQSDASSGTATATLTGEGVANSSIVDLANGNPVSDLSGIEDSQRIYRIQVPSSATLISISISGSSGDADLYIRHGAVPTLNDYDFRPFLTGSDETVEVDDPVTGDWYIMLHGYTDYSGLTLRAWYARSTGGVTEFTNNETILLDDSGPGSLYPSQIEVSGLSGSIQKVRVTLHELSHTFSSDIDLLLVAPDGTSVLLISDAGGGNDIVDIELVIDDDANSSLNTMSSWSSGLYRPTNVGSGDAFPAPAPVGPYSTTLSAFEGLSANGTWELYLLDDASEDSGSLSGGWTLEIETGSNTLSLPDLTDGSGAYSLSPANASVGDEMTFAMDISNQGAQPSGSFELQLQFSSDTTFTEFDSTAQVVTVPSIAAGEVYYLNVTFQVPPLTPGDYYLGWHIDYDDQVEESDDNNNRFHRNTLIQINPSAADDAYEENDSLVSAYSFDNEGVWLSQISGSGIQSDDDWFAIQAQIGEVLLVTCLFSHSEGDIDLELYDSSGNLVSEGYSYSVTDNEQMEVSLPHSGDYYVLVHFGNTGNDYDLRWQTYSGNLAPDANVIAARLPGQTINGISFSSETRFNWEGYGGDWGYQRVSTNEGLITQTYDFFSNDPDSYREETLLYFITSTTGTYRYREYEQGILNYENTGTFDFPWLAVAATTWYDASLNLGAGWRWSSWFGTFNIANEPWLYHLEHGWIFIFPSVTDPDSVYFWDGEMDAVLWTSEALYPTLYRFSDAQWMYYLKDSDNPRWFINLLTNQWEQW